MLCSFICSCSPGEFGLARPRRDQPQHAGADVAHVRRRPAADLHADAERLVPALHQLNRVHGSGEEPGGAASEAIDATANTYCFLQMAHASRPKEFRVSGWSPAI